MTSMLAQPQLKKFVRSFVDTTLVSPVWPVLLLASSHKITLKCLPVTNTLAYPTDGSKKVSLRWLQDRELHPQLHWKCQHPTR